MVEYCTL